VAPAVIPEPHRSYLLELIRALGPAAEHFVLAGAQAMKFMLRRPRATGDFDFALDIVALRSLDVPVAEVLSSLRYEVVRGAENFQFQKPIPGTLELMRIEFIGPELYRQKGDIRVKVQEGVHARACTGAEIALHESVFRQIEGRLPTGEATTTQVRVVQPWALVMLKCLAFEDRYRSLRGTQHAEHDRNEARIHASDIVTILQERASLEEFGQRFLQQLEPSPGLRQRVLRVVPELFGDQTKPGLLLYEELLAMRSSPVDDAAVQQGLRRAERLLAPLVDLCIRQALARLPDEGSR
jgi:hypothetical protein